MQRAIAVTTALWAAASRQVVILKPMAHRARIAAWVLYCALAACGFERGPLASGNVRDGAEGPSEHSGPAATLLAGDDLASDGGDPEQTPSAAGASSAAGWDASDAGTKKGAAGSPAPATPAEANGAAASDASIAEADAQTTDGEVAAQDAAAPPARFSAACSQDGDCRSDEACVRSSGPGAISYCSQRCSAASDCEAQPDFPKPVCTSQGFGGEGRCRITCDFLVNQSCPGDMVCQDLLVIFPAGTGTCGFAS